VLAMPFQELYFTFPCKLTQEQEDVFVGHVLAVRDSQVLKKIANLKATASLQAKVPFNPAKSVLEGYVMQCQLIEDQISDLFILEPVESDFDIQKIGNSRYRLKLSTALNVGIVDKVTKLMRAFADPRWVENLANDMKVKSIAVGGV
jgi:hypothetical protein